MNHRHLDPDLLAGAVPAAWAQDARRALGALQDALTPTEPGTPGDDERTGTSCPVCLGTAALHRHGPALLDRIGVLATALASALREDGAETETPGDTEEGAGTGESGPAGLREGDRGTAPTHRRRPPTTVQIDVSG
ncbi:hypothetical protein KIH74_19045 [Kineosporia sp. J2-2]|uniref:Uncharacterized protein n=1 Tax=Kineosporia corallincola TaxID=2835133 RepID=A0ABS5TL05_9ACTN|nr:hypothetical protein [Kineosporia corallincola]MBT0771044.1 hypothetical protein [Kineosporia corallincola]